MADTASQLKIRVQLQEEETGPVEPPDETVEYRWDRIITALVLTLLVVSSAIGLGLYLLKTPEETAPLYQVSPVTLISEEAEEAEETEEPSPQTESPEQDFSVALPANKAPEEEPQAETTMVTPESVGPDETRAVEETDLRGIISGMPALVIIRAPEHIHQARLSTGISNREPVNSAPALIPMDHTGLMRLFMFTELNNLKGERIHHDWYRNDQREARVTMNPQLDQLKAHSSKYINANMRGNWRVEVVRDSGELLAETAFEVR